MADIPAIFRDLAEQWGAFLVARLCLASTTTLADLEPKVNSVSGSNQIFAQGYQMARSYKTENLNIMAKSVELVIFQFHQHESFPELFSELIAQMNTAFDSPISEIARRKNEKALHTDKIVAAETLSAMDKVCIDAFKWLSSIVDSAASCGVANFKDIRGESITIVFRYVEHYLPNSVRASAGKIVASLSASPKHAQMLCDMFWQKFSSCKKDDEFRNFSTWIDGIMGCQLSLETPELTQTSVSFLSTFVTKAKKMERGVLRMKFLSALSAILSRICKSKSIEPCAEVVSNMDEIWGIVVKWANRKKHVVFCLDFLGQVMVSTFPGYFTKHAAQFFELLYKVTKAENGPVPLLQVILNVFKDMPKEYYANQFAECKANIDNSLLPLFFKMNDKLKRPRFDKPEQNRIVVQTLVQIGLKQLLPVIDFCRHIFGDQTQDENKKGRLTCLEVLSELARAIPEPIAKFSDELFPFIQPMLLRTSPNPAEIELAIFTFPLIHAHDEMILAQISQILFDLATGEKVPIASAAFMALTGYIEQLIGLDRNALSPINYMNVLLKGLPTLPKAAISDQLSYIYGILHAYAIAMSKNLSEITDFGKGTFALTPEDWLSFRLTLDKMMLPLLFYPDVDIVKLVEELQKECMSESIRSLDMHCSAKTHYTLAVAVTERGEGKDHYATLQLLQENNPELMESLFESTLELWRSNASRFDENYTGKIMHVLATVAQPSFSSLPNFFEELFKVLKQNPTDMRVFQCIPIMSPQLWILLLNELNTWMTTTGLTIASFWTQFTGVYYVVANNNKFKELMVEEPKLIEAFERYIANLLKTQNKGDADGYTTCEKGLKILWYYIANSPDHFSRLIEPTEGAFGRFLDAIQRLMKHEQSAAFTATFVETFISSLTTIFEFADIDQYGLFDGFMKWLAVFSKHFETKEQAQILIVRMLTMLLTRNPVLLRLYFRTSFVQDGVFASKFLLAMSNVYKRREADFEDRFVNGSAILLSAALVHLRNDNAIPRQAAHKLMCMMVSKEHTVFTKEIQTELMMSLTSHSPAGYVTQSQHFLGFVSKAITQAMAVDMFNVIADDLNIIELPQAAILYALDDLLSLLVSGSTLYESAGVLLRLTSQTKLSDKDSAVEIRKVWAHYLDLLQERDVSDLVKFVFDYVLEKNDLKGCEAFAGINVMIFIFFKYPNEIANLLIPLLGAYDRSVPTDVNEFLTYLQETEVDFAVQKTEIVAYNTLSQILLLTEDKELFKTLFLEKLPQLTFFAVMMFDHDEFSIGTFHPLLDALLDAALFRFAKNQSKFSANLETLHHANLVIRATSLDCQYQIATELTQSKHMLAYDQNAVVSISRLLCQEDREFKDKFFDIVLANALKVKSCEREMEPFLMTMALNGQMTTRSLFHILLFSVHAFTHDRRDLLDSLADIVRQRLCSDQLDHTQFAAEVVPVVIVFLLYLSLDCRRSFSIHVIRVLGDVCRRVSTLEEREQISAELNKFLEQYKGEEYISSLFVRFLSEVTTLADPSVGDIIRGLYELANVLGITKGSSFSWCLILALLADGLRYFIAQKTSRQIDHILNLDGLDWSTTDTFVEFIKSNFGDPRQHAFVVKFIGYVLKKFVCVDLGRDTAAMAILSSFLQLVAVELEPAVRDAIIRAAMLTGFTADDNGTKEAARIVAILIKEQTIPVGKESLSASDTRAKYVETVFKPIGHWQSYKRFTVDKATLPEFRLFDMLDVSTQNIVDTLYRFISERLSTA